MAPEVIYREHYLHRHCWPQHVVDKQTERSHTPLFKQLNFFELNNLYELNVSDYKYVLNNGTILNPVMHIVIYSN